MSSTFTIGSIASGAGMHLHGLKAIGGVPTWAIEMDEAIAHCYIQNHGGKIHIKKVEEVLVQDLEPVDLLIATLSCKNASISKGAKRGEIQADIDAANATAAIIKAIKPKWFMLENVWLYRQFEGFKLIQSTLEELGYYFKFYKFNLRDWGIAQSRDRLYALASRDGSFPDPEVGQGGRGAGEQGWYEAIADMIDQLPETTLAPWQQKKFPELVNSCLIPSQSYALPVEAEKPALTVTATNRVFRALIKRVGGGRDSDRLYQETEPAFTIRAVGRKSDHHSRIADAVVGDKIVAVTPRACLRFFGDKETADSIWLPPTKSLACEVVGNGASWVMFKELFECLSQEQGVGGRVSGVEGRGTAVSRLGQVARDLTKSPRPTHYTLHPAPTGLSQQSKADIDIETVANDLISDKQVTPRFRSHLVEYLHEAYGLRASTPQPDLTCFVNAQANIYSFINQQGRRESEVNNIAGDVQVCAVRASKGDIQEVIPGCKNLNFAQSRVLLDSGAFPEVIANCRVTPEESLQRQLRALAKLAGGIAALPKFKETWIVSYDRLIDEKHVNGTRVKQRWSVEEGELAVTETVEAAKYLDSQRHLLQDYTLVQSCQGVDAQQYLRCVEQVLKYCRPGDVVGLGGWCILGRQASYLQTFWETINLVIPAIASAGIKKVHIFGVTWYKPRKNQPLPPLQPLLWLCDQYGIKLSTDGRSPISNALWTDTKRAGATFPYWRHNLAWVKAELATLRESPLYQAPPGWEKEAEEQRSRGEIAVQSPPHPTPHTPHPANRHHLDFYESPWWFTTELLRYVKLEGVIGEPCVGGGAFGSAVAGGIASLLQAWPHIKQIWTNDIDPSKQADYHHDAVLAESWGQFPETDWIITNPPYGENAAPIIKNAYSKARVGVVAFLLTSFLEPCGDRAEFLKQHPPSLVLTFPRYCFRKDKSGKRWATDNITISCIVWDKRATNQQLIVRPQSEIIGFYKNPDQAISLCEAKEIVKSIAALTAKPNASNSNTPTTPKTMQPQSLTRATAKPETQIVDQNGELGVIEDDLGFGFTVLWTNGEEVAYNWERDSEIIKTFVISYQPTPEVKPMEFQFPEADAFLEKVVEDIAQQIAQLQAQLTKYQECQANANQLKEQVAAQAQLMVELGVAQQSITDWANRIYFLATGTNVAAMATRSVELAAKLTLLEQDNKALKYQLDNVSAEVEEVKQERDACGNPKGERLLNSVQELESQSQSLPKFVIGERVTTQKGEGVVTSFVYGNPVVKLPNGEFQFNEAELTKTQFKVGNDVRVIKGKSL